MMNICEILVMMLSLKMMIEQIDKFVCEEQEMLDRLLSWGVVKFFSFPCSAFNATQHYTQHYTLV